MCEFAGVYICPLEESTPTSENLESSFLHCVWSKVNNERRQSYKASLDVVRVTLGEE